MCSEYDYSVARLNYDTLISKRGRLLREHSRDAAYLMYHNSTGEAIIIR
jgi:hypothetical protein